LFGLEIEICEKPGPVPELWSLIYWPGLNAGPVVQENPRKVKECLGLNSVFRKMPGLGPGPARSLVWLSWVVNAS